MFLFWKTWIVVLTLLTISVLCRQQEEAAQSQKSGQSLSIKFNQSRVAEQLRYSGVLEAVRVARFGYNIKLTHYEFYIR